MSVKLFSSLERLVRVMPYAVGLLGAALSPAYFLTSCDSESSQNHSSYVVYTEPVHVTVSDKSESLSQEDFQKQLLREANDCGTYCRDKDGDGFGWKGECESGCNLTQEEKIKKKSYVPNADDCNDVMYFGEAIYPGAVELCNSLDDNCDGTTDEGFDVGMYCAKGIGACFDEGKVVCVDEFTSECDALTLSPLGTEEICTNNIDDNCNGELNEDCCYKEGEIFNEVPCDNSYKVLFIVDHSTSIKNKLEEIKENVALYGEKIFSSGVDVEVGILGFDDDVFEYGGFVKSQEELEESLALMSVTDGSLGWEAQLEALLTATQYEWGESKRLALLVTDAEFYDDQHIGQTAQEIIKSEIELYGIFIHTGPLPVVDMYVLFQALGATQNLYEISKGDVFPDLFNFFVAENYAQWDRCTADLDFRTEYGNCE